MCPGLYRAEDAASSKAHELLLAAAQTLKTAERERMVAEAVGIAKQIAGSLRLDVSKPFLQGVNTSDLFSWGSSSCRVASYSYPLLALASCEFTSSIVDLRVERR